MSEDVHGSEYPPIVVEHRLVQVDGYMSFPWRVCSMAEASDWRHEQQRRYPDLLLQIEQRITRGDKRLDR